MVTFTTESNRPPGRFPQTSTLAQTVTKSRGSLGTHVSIARRARMVKGCRGATKNDISPPKIISHSVVIITQSLPNIEKKYLTTTI